jgi:hypothetical protein
MPTLSVQIAVLTGLNPSYGAADAGGDEFANSGREVIHVKNGHTSEQTVTVDSKAVCSQGYDHNAVVAIPAGEERIIGPFPKVRFDDPSTGKVAISYSGVISLTIAVIRVP